MKKKNKIKDYVFAFLFGIIFGCFIAFVDWARFFIM